MISSSYGHFIYQESHGMVQTQFYIILLLKYSHKKVFNWVLCAVPEQEQSPSQWPAGSSQRPS